MYTALTLFVFIGLTANAHADLHQPCHPPNMTGTMIVMSLKGEVKALGTFTYDSTGNKLRFKSNDSHPLNTSEHLDLLMFFDEGVFYEIDSKNHSCEKKSLQSTLHPLEIPSDATFLAALNPGSATVEGEGIKVNVWRGYMPGTKDYYSMSVTMGCLPVSILYFSESSPLLFSNMDIESEIKDPDLLLVPSICEGHPLEETPEGTVHSFLNEFM
ncbi:ependymin [Thalassophryne amazonica]|uniref:ependymin n=1 Tax=Thalassophryne amazonica TaxID=390379 RepID=UPI001470ACE2|nr:ependymin [Thalassophryne amazonica]